MFKYFLFFLGVIVCIPALAQVPASVQVNRNGDAHKSVIIGWNGSEEQEWHLKNGDRLEVMAIATNIPSEMLTTGRDDDSFKIELAGNYFIEAIIETDSFEEGDWIKILHNGTGKVVYEIKSPVKSNHLTALFDPRQCYFAFNTEHGRFNIRTLYIHRQHDRGGQIGFNTALPCHPNAICKEDSMMRLIAQSSVRIRMVMEEGIGWCTGSFINNTRNDKTPYILSAHHCTFDYTPRYDMWRFDLLYESATCDNPSVEPEFISFTGCNLVAKGQASDFLLLLLEESLPLNIEVTFAGWDRNDSATPDTSYLIHHPNADIRKLSTSTNKAVIHPNQIGWSEGYTTPAHHHFRFKFTEGGHQAGSSGGPVYNEHFLLIGQLHGGTHGCEEINSAYVGRFSKSWNSGTSSSERLMDWLDPDNTLETTLASLENLAEEEVINIHGHILNPAGLPVRNATISVTGSTNEMLVTDDQGYFTLDGVSRSGEYVLTPAKDVNPLNGLNVQDIVAIQKHLLGKDPFDHAWQLVAADATNNIEVSVGDILVMLRLLLGKITFFPTSPSWRFDPPSITVDSFPADPTLEVQFTGIKIGDVNGTADPSQ